MSFFYDLNKRLANLAKTQEQAEAKAAEPIAESKFSKLAKEIGKNPKVKNPAAVASAAGFFYALVFCSFKAALRLTSSNDVLMQPGGTFQNFFERFFSGNIPLYCFSDLIC